jgi:hypothetical protein
MFDHNPYRIIVTRIITFNLVQKLITFQSTEEQVVSVYSIGNQRT